MDTIHEEVTSADPQIGSEMQNGDSVDAVEDRVARSASESRMARVGSTASNMSLNSRRDSRTSVTSSTATNQTGVEEETADTSRASSLDPLKVEPGVRGHSDANWECKLKERVQHNRRERYSPTEEVITPIQETGNPSFSVRVPPLHPESLELYREINFLMKLTSSHRESMKIQNISSLLSQKKAIIRNVPFVLKSKFAYKLCMHVSIGENGHFSVSVMILKGEHDKSLPWPFTMSVVFRLVNQEFKQDKVGMFRCDRNATRFKDSLYRPKGPSNPPLGFPMFISKQMLLDGGFVKENSICLECYLFPKETKLSLDSELPAIIKM